MMENDIDYHLFEDSFDIDEVGKYGKFDYFNGSKDVLFFYKRTLTKQKLSEEDRFLSMENMKFYLDKRIEEELKQNEKLQSKINKIREAAKKKIEKLQEKPKKKLKDKYNYHEIEKYFMPHCEEESSVSSESEPSSP